jgi:hypothetical protein
MSTAKALSGTTAEPAGRVSWQRLAGVTLVVTVCLAAAAVLGMVCYHLNEDYRQQPDPAAHAATQLGPEAPPPAPQTAGTVASLVRLPAAEQALVSQAVLRGVRFLKTSQQDSGSWGTSHMVGYAALPALTLLECGVPPSDPNVQRAAAFVRTQVPGMASTYELSLAILFLDRLGDPADKESIRILAMRLIAGQNRTGGWTYGCPVLPQPAHKQLFFVLKEIKSQAGQRPAKPAVSEPLLPEVQNLPILQDLSAVGPGKFKQFQGDNSNTQFAILALWVAQRHEVPLARTAALFVQRFRHSQKTDGSWHYGAAQFTTPSTTCAGLLGLAVGQGVGVEQSPASTPPEKDPSVQKALAYLGRFIGEPVGVKKGQIIPMPDLYFLWSLERVAVLYGLTQVEGKDWYAWAVEVLLANQQVKGNWKGSSYHGSSPVIDTCFALLALVQANLAQDLTTKLQLLGSR